jgi:hypothetical protein
VPYAYLRYLFTELPKAETVETIEALLPAITARIRSGSAEQARGSFYAHRYQRQLCTGLVN